MSDELLKSFAVALHRGDAAAVRKLLGEHLRLRDAINEPLGHFGSRPIHVAVGWPTLEVLLEFGADPDLATDWSEGPFRAIDEADESTARHLISRGATLTPHAAARLGWIDELRDLLDRDPTLVHQPGGDGRRPLHWAENSAVVDLLLDRLADVDARCLDHLSTPAQYAVKERPQVCTRLLERGAVPDVFMSAHRGDIASLQQQLGQHPELAGHIISRPGYNRVSTHCIYNWTFGFGKLPHDVALDANQHEALEVLMERSWPELRFAACASIHERRAREMLAESPDLPRRMNGILHGRLATAAFFGRFDMATAMLGLGFDPAATGHDGGTALHAAAWAGSAAVVEAILGNPRGAGLIEARDARYLATPLGWCCHGSIHCGRDGVEHGRVAQILIDHGAAVGADTGESSEAVRAVLNGARRD